MSASAAAILGHLQVVAAERQRRAADPALDARVVALKAYQQRRFSLTYADLLRNPRYGAAARFFLVELYGPTDFTRRDAQFARVVPALVRLFPEEIVATVATVAELHALSETLDTAAAEALDDAPIDAEAYLQAWQRVGRMPDRARQVELTLRVAAELDRFTRKPLLRSTLRLMRGPARAAGLSELQRFLESGLETFGAMKGAQHFVDLVGARERDFAAALFAAPGGDPAATERALAGLP